MCLANQTEAEALPPWGFKCCELGASAGSFPARNAQAPRHGLTSLRTASSVATHADSRPTAAEGHFNLDSPSYLPKHPSP